MSSSPWSRIKEGRLFQVLLAFLAVSWIVLQIVDNFIDNLGLPAWVFITTLVLLSTPIPSSSRWWKTSDNVSRV